MDLQTREMHVFPMITAEGSDMANFSCRNNAPWGKFYANIYELGNSGLGRDQ